MPTGSLASQKVGNASASVQVPDTKKQTLSVSAMRGAS